jgi:hypothetical protein
MAHRWGEVTLVCCSLLRLMNEKAFFIIYNLYVFILRKWHRMGGGGVNK